MTGGNDVGGSGPPAGPLSRQTSILLRTTVDTFDAWEVRLEVPYETTIGELKGVLNRPPYSLKLQKSQRILKKMRGSVCLTAQDHEQVAPRLMLLNFEPESHTFEPQPSPLPSNGAQPDQALAAETTGSTTTATAPASMAAAPDAAASDAAAPIPQSAPGSSLGQPSDQDAAAPVKREKAARAVEAMMRAEMFRLIMEFQKMPPRDRRGESYGRSIGWAYRLLKMHSSVKLMKPLRGAGLRKAPVEVWVLAAHNEVEGVLAMEGFFKNADCMDMGFTNISICGAEVQPLPRNPESDGGRVSVRLLSYRTLLEERPPAPDLVVLLMPEEEVPAEVLDMAVAAPIAVTTRCRLTEEMLEDVDLEFNAEGPQGCLLTKPTPHIFSASPPTNTTENFKDNGWIVCLRDAHALSCLNKLILNPDWYKGVPRQEASKIPTVEVEPSCAKKIPTVFWGIVDLKYDRSLPIWDRVKVLETGDGRTSRFSGDGADILTAYQQGFCLEEGGGAAAAKHAVISANKKLTHDLIEAQGYSHLLPRQVWFPREYRPDLALRIAQGLGLGEEDSVVLKLCNRTRAAGVLPVPVRELDGVLEKLLILPEDTEAWLARAEKNPKDVFALSGFEEQVRHWWSNECPFFVVERLCKSMLCEWEGGLYDATMRVAFALCRKTIPPGEDKPGTNTGANPADGGEREAPELEVRWLGGYWKLPKLDVKSGELRDRVISAARTSGTAAVDPRCLAEIYGALTGSIQAIFSGELLTPEILRSMYEADPVVLSYLTARLATTFRNKGKSDSIMDQAKRDILTLANGPAKRAAKSFIYRAMGVTAFRAHIQALDHSDKNTSYEQLPQAEKQLNRSLESYPFNATSLFILGMLHLEEGGPDYLPNAARLMFRSHLLDPDFKGPCVNLAAVLLRAGAYELALLVSEKGLDRHPQSPQCAYHAGLALYRMSLNWESNRAAEKWHEGHREKALANLEEARNSDEAQRLKERNKLTAPWTTEDEQIIKELRAFKSVFVTPRRKPPVELSPTVGWLWYQWRT